MQHFLRYQKLNYQKTHRDYVNILSRYNSDPLHPQNFPANDPIAPDRNEMTDMKTRQEIPSVEELGDVRVPLKYDDAP